MADHDLAALWEEHCRYEFETRDVDATVATMVDAPYVNHVPTMTGGNAARLRALKRRFDPDGVFASVIPLPDE